MDFRLSKDQAVFQEGFSDWLQKNLPRGWDPSRNRHFETHEDWSRAYRDFQKRLYDGGYSAMHWPEDYGGQGKTLMEEVIVLRTIFSTCAELKMPGVITHAMAAPTIYHCGNEDQKRTFLPRIMDGTHLWCQGFSEPDAGSDVANVATHALRKNSHYTLNGQKVWTSFAHLADYCILVARTNTEVPKHQGLTYFLMDMKSPGVSVRPLRQITGDAEFNEVFLDDVHIPVEMRLGEEGQGWEIAMTTLMYERVLGDAILGAFYQKHIETMLDMARNTYRSGKRVIQNPIFRQQLGHAYIDVMVLKYHGLRSLSQQIKTRLPGPEGSISKLLWSESNQKKTEWALGMQGPDSQIVEGSPQAIQNGFWQYHFLRSKGNTIEAGTSEILRNIIGERVLGLPKDMSRAKRK